MINFLSLKKIFPSLDGRRSNCNPCLKRAKERFCAILTIVAPFWKSRDEEADLKKCLINLKKIVYFSTIERTQWYCWYHMHCSPPNVLTWIGIYGVSYDWNIMCLSKIKVFVKALSMETSCGGTQNIVLARLLGAKKAAHLSLQGKSHPFQNLEAILKNQKPLIVSFRIPPFYLHFENNTTNKSVVFYGGHCWTIFKAGKQCLLISSYLDRRTMSVKKLKDKQIEFYIKAMHIISNARKWTKKVNLAYRRWFHVSHGELIGRSPVKKKSKTPWQITFKWAFVSLDKLDNIEKDFFRARQSSYFPEYHIQ